MNRKYSLKEGLFYITNVCNLTCEHCESYNNLNFKGHFSWKEHGEQYKEWSKIVSLDRINIHGGEPVTNPDLYEWADNLIKLWPDTIESYISSNGTLLGNKIELCRELINMGWNLDIVVHDPSQLTEVLNTIKEILKVYNFKIRHTDPKKKRIEFRTADTDKLLLSLEQVYHFIPKSQKLVENGVIYMHRNDPDKSYALCTGTCDHPAGWFLRGGIYHCYMTSLAYDITSQFKVEEYAEKLLKDYKPCLLSDPEEVKEEFFNIVGKKSIKQCTLCPDKGINFPIFPLNPKKKKL
jgi:organic radical activating enzyme